MKSLLKLVMVFGVAAAIVDVMLRRAASRNANVPTLHGIEDAEPNRPEPLTEEDLKIAQNAPL
jgi:hypothetical protein